MKKIQEKDLEFNGVQMCCIVKIHTKLKSKKRKVNYCMSSMSIEFSGYTKSSIKIGYKNNSRLKCFLSFWNQFGTQSFR